MIVNRPFSLFDDSLKDIRGAEIYPNFSLKDCGLFAQTSQAAEEAVAFLRLLPSVVDAEPESYQQKDETKLAAIAILKRHPELLFRKGIVTDHFGRKIWASPYQLFLGAGDTWAIKQVHEEILPNIKGGEDQAEVQFKAQFPHCPWPYDSSSEEQFYDNRNREQIAQVIAQLKTIVGKIAIDPCTNGLAVCHETINAVEDLCQIFKPKKGEVIKTGLHFPLAIMIEIGKVYDDQWTHAQRSFFSRKVIGSALRASTAVDGQNFKNGLNILDMKKGPDRRDGLFCCHPKGVPQDLAPIKDKLGLTMFVDPQDGESCFLTSVASAFDWYNKMAWCCRAWAFGAASLDLLTTYVNKKQRHMGTIMEPVKCVIF